MLGWLLIYVIVLESDFQHRPAAHGERFTIRNEPILVALTSIVFFTMTSDRHGPSYGHTLHRNLSIQYKSIYHYYTRNSSFHSLKFLDLLIALLTR